MGGTHKHTEGCKRGHEKGGYDTAGTMPWGKCSSVGHAGHTVTGKQGGTHLHHGPARPAPRWNRSVWSRASSHPPSSGAERGMLTHGSASAPQPSALPHSPSSAPNPASQLPPCPKPIPIRCSTALVLPQTLPHGPNPCPTSPSLPHMLTPHPSLTSPALPHIPSPTLVKVLVMRDWMLLVVVLKFLQTWATSRAAKSRRAQWLSTSGRRQSWRLTMHVMTAGMSSWSCGTRGRGGTRGSARQGETWGDSLGLGGGHGDSPTSGCRERW